MQTIRLRVNEKVYKHLMWFLNKFRKDELEIVEEESDFFYTQKTLVSELKKLSTGEVEFIDLTKLDESLENTIRKYEDKDPKEL